MKKLQLISMAMVLATLLLGCGEKAGEAPDPNAPNLKGKPSGPRPSPSVGGGGGGETKGGPGAPGGGEVKLQ